MDEGDEGVEGDREDNKQTKRLMKRGIMSVLYDKYRCTSNE